MAELSLNACIQLHLVTLDSSFTADEDVAPREQLLQPFLNLLDSESFQQIRAFRRQEDAQRCIISRLLPRHVIQQNFQIPSQEIRFDRNANGRPFAVHPRLPSNFDYNVSHDENLVAIGFSRGDYRIGVDIMRLKIPWQGDTIQEFIQGLKDQLTFAEMASIQAHQDENLRLRHVMAIWTLKEAYSKVTGEGLRTNFQSLEFIFRGTEVGKITASLDGEELNDCCFQLFSLAESYIGAIAIHYTGSARTQWREDSNVQVQVREIEFEQIKLALFA